MKLRIRGDSLRLRLSRGEIGQLQAQGRVSQAIHFGPGSAIEYAIELAEVDAPGARFESGTLTLALPRALGLAWASGDEVGIEATQALPEGQLALLIEKDGTQRLYFVVETKSSLFTDDLRDKESAKIECGKAHFQALGVGENPARYVVARTINDLLNTTT